MPNHFHFLILVNDESIKSKVVGSLTLTGLNNGFRTLQSSYAAAINKEFVRTGSLFQQKAKYKLLESDEYLSACLHYIHQNPLRAGLVDKLEDWKHSSFLEYAGIKNEGLCSHKKLFQLTGLDTTSFYKASYKVLPDGLLDKVL